MYSSQLPYKIPPAFYGGGVLSGPKMDFKSGLPNLTGSKLNPQLTGIIDSEGNFSILVQKTENGRDKISLAFKVTQKEHSKGILIYLQKYFVW